MEQVSRAVSPPSQTAIASRCSTETPSPPAPGCPPRRVRRRPRSGRGHGEDGAARQQRRGRPRAAQSRGEARRRSAAGPAGPAGRARAAGQGAVKADASRAVAGPVPASYGRAAGAARRWPRQGPPAGQQGPAQRAGVRRAAQHHEGRRADEKRGRQVGEVAGDVVAGWRWPGPRRGRCGRGEGRGRFADGEGERPATG